MNDGNENVSKPKSRRGFASLSRERNRELSAKGGKIAHARGTAHEFTTEEAHEAGRKGGNALLEKRGREHFVAIARIAGEKRRERAALKRAAQAQTASA